MRELIGPRNYPFYSVAIAQLLAGRYVHLYLACSVVALLYLVAEWLYLGKYPRQLWLGLVFGLCLVGLLQGYWLQPTLKGWHRLQYARVEQREAAARAFRLWSGVSQGLNLLAVAGLTVYLWRVAHPADPTRFVGPTKFRS